MPNKLAKKDLEEILKPLPLKDRKLLMEEELTAERVQNTLERYKLLLKRDIWAGRPWFVIYTFALFTKGIHVITVGIFVVGMIYFITTALTTGSYGLNRKRVKVFESLLERLRNK
jgi:hypothetical protein